MSRAEDLLQGTNPAVTDYANRLLIASQLFLAHKTKVAGENLTASMAELATGLKGGLDNHANALRTPQSPRTGTLAR